MSDQYNKLLNQMAAYLETMRETTESYVSKFGVLSEAISNALNYSKEAEQSAASAAHSASEASEISGLDTLASGVGLLSPRLDTPDFLCSFNDGIEIEHGYGTRNTHGNRAIDYSRASAETSINKSGQLVTLATDEPAIESSGIALFQNLTNLATSSEPTNYSPTSESNPNFASLVYTATKNSGSLEVKMPVFTVSAGKKYTVRIYTEFLSGIEVVRLYLSGTAELRCTLVKSSKSKDGLYLWIGEFETLNGDNSLELRVGAYSPDPLSVKVAEFQCIEGNIPNAPYIPTSGVAVTRAADVAKVTSVNNLPAAGKPWYCVVDVDFGDLSTNSYRQILRQKNNSILFFLDINNKVVVRLYDKDKSQQANAFKVTDKIKLRVIFSISDKLSLYFDGVKVSEEIIGINTYYDFSDIYIGSNSNGTEFLNGHIKNLTFKHGVMTDDLAKSYGAHPDA